jgi:hypothetical protein
MYIMSQEFPAIRTVVVNDLIYGVAITGPIFIFCWEIATPSEDEFLFYVS